MKNSKFTWLSIIVLFFSAFYSSVCFSQNASSLLDLGTQILNQQIFVLRESNQATKYRLERLSESQEAFKNRYGLGLEEVTQQQLDLAQINLSLSQSDVSRLSSSLQSARQEYVDIQADINSMEYELLIARRDELLSESELQALESTLAQTRTHADLHSTRIRLLIDSLQDAEQIVQLNRDWVEFIQNAYQAQQRIQQDSEFHQYVEQALAEQQTWLEQLTAANKQSESLTQADVLEDGERLNLQIRIFYLKEKIRLSELAIKQAYAQNQVKHLLQLSTQPRDFSLSEQLNEVKRIQTHVNEIVSELGEIIALIQNQQVTLTEGFANQLINESQYQSSQQLLEELIGQYQEQLQDTARLSDQLAQLASELADEIVIEASKRKGLPGLDKTAWLDIIDQVASIPAATWNYLTVLYQHIKERISEVPQYYYPFMFFILAAFILAWFIARYYAEMVISAVAQARQRVSSNLVYIISQLIWRNLLGLILFCAGLFFVFFLRINFASYALLFYLALAWFIFRFTIGIARLSLVERISDVSGADVRLYKGLKWVFVLGGVIIALTIASYQLQLSDPTQALFIRLFLLFLLAVSFVLFKGRHVVPSLLESILDSRRAYLKRTIHLLSILIPLTIFFDVIIGLVGYVDIARTISYYQIILLLVVSLYMIVRGLIIDLMDIASKLMIRYFKNGWLLSEALLKPLDKVLRIVIFLLAWVVLFKLYGWGREHITVVTLKNILTYDILIFTTGEISLLNIIEFIVLVAVFIWAARWLKEFAYRWIFRNVKDSGIRYSLSNFLQYSIVTVGIIFTLRILGIDFTSLAVILGGLAVGLGFGLRDFANNIVSGLMLLIERPVREGDLITVSNFEGRVTHVGLRSIRVRSWDRMEVVVPNSELFNKIFTNWTRQDNIVRTVVPVKVQRQENVFRIQQLIHEVLTEIPSVLSEPIPEVYLRQIDDALLEFEVRYFIDVQVSKRPEIRSNVLFSVWKKFEQYGIKPPYPQQDIHLKSLPHKV